MKKISRKTDSLLDWAATCGGVRKALEIIGGLLVSTYSSYALKSTLALNLVRFVPSESINSNMKAKDKENRRKEEFK